MVELLIVCHPADRLHVDERLAATPSVNDVTIMNAWSTYGSTMTVPDCLG